MTVLWTEGAYEDLREIREYIAGNNEGAAQKIAEDIFAACESLGTFPYRGRLVKGTDPRELVISNGPYIVRYTVSTDAVLIVSIRHGARSFPQR